MTLRIAAVKRTGHRDRFYVVRPDGSEASWAVASAPGLPHDLHHWLVESALGLRRAFWGMVSDGMEPGYVRGVVEHVGGDRSGLTELLQAEAAVASVFGPEETDEGRATALTAALADAGLPPLAVGAGDVAAIRRRAAELAAGWEALPPGRALDLTF